MRDITSTPTEHEKVLQQLFEQLLNNSSVNNNASIRRELNHNMSRMNDRSFKIAVIGEFSSGKSTFLNAVIGKDYLTHGVQETTATVTMLVNTSEHPQSYGTITFTDGSTQSLDSYEQLKNVTTTHSTCYQVSRQIESVALFLPFINTELPVVFVDTPGLNGVAAMHEDRTIDIVQSAHACIYMLQSRGISETDQKTLQWVGQYQSELILVQNFIDDISTSEGDTLEDVLNQQRNILSDRVFSGQEQVHYTVCGVSAMKALASKDTSITRLYSTDLVDLTDLDRQRLYQESNFEQAMNCIHQFIQQAFERAHRSTLYAVYHFLERTARIMTTQYDNNHALFEHSDEAQVLLRTKQLLDNWDSRQAENAKKLDHFIVSKMNEGRRLTIKELRRLIEAEQGHVPRIYGHITNPEEWDSFIKDKRIEATITGCSKKIQTEVETFLEDYCENTHNLAILRIEEYSGLTDVFSNQSLPAFKPTALGEGVRRFTQEADDINADERELQRLVVQRKMMDIQKKQLLEDEQRFQSSFHQGQQKRTAIESHYHSQTKRLGGKPEARVYYETVTDYVSRGGNGFFDFVFGKKKVSRQEARYDYSAQRQWEENARLLQNDYSKKNAALNAQLRSLEQTIADTKQKITVLNADSNADFVRVQRKQAIIREKIASLNEKRLFATQEYLRGQKEKLRKNVCDYLNDTLQEALAEHINHEILRIKEHLSPIVRELYLDVSENQKKELQQRLHQRPNDKGVQHESMREDLQNVLEMKKFLEGYLCKQ